MSLSEHIAAYGGDTEVPKWVAVFIEEWAERLMISHWRISVRMSRLIMGEPDIMALCEQQTEINGAIIHVREGLEEDEETKIFILHELIHIAHARIDHFVEGAIIARQPEMLQEISHEGYKQTYEPFVHRLAYTLYHAAYQETKEPSWSDTELLGVEMGLATQAPRERMSQFV